MWLSQTIWKSDMPWSHQADTQTYVECFESHNDILNFSVIAFARQMTYNIWHLLGRWQACGTLPPSCLEVCVCPYVAFLSTACTFSLITVNRWFWFCFFYFCLFYCRTACSTQCHSLNSFNEIEGMVFFMHCLILCGCSLISHCHVE